MDPTIEYLPEGSEWSVRYYKETLDEEARLLVPTKESFLGLYFNLGPEHRYKVKGGRSGTFYKDQFNFLYLPKKGAEFFLPKGEFTVFSIRFTPGYLLQFTKGFPKVDDFMKRIGNGVPAFLGNFNLIAGSKVLEAIREIITRPRNSTEEDAIILQSRVMDILAGSLQHIMHQSSAQLLKGEIGKIERAREYALKNLHRNISATTLADYVDMDKRKFEKVFRVVLDKTVYNFLIEERLSKAFDLLRSTDLSINEVAIKVGYKVHPVFTRAFHAKFGYPPRDLRRP